MRFSERLWREKEEQEEGMIQTCILGESGKYLGDRSVDRGRHQATAGLVVFARGPKPQDPLLLPCTTCILGSRRLHRTNPGCQRVGRKDEGRGKK